MPIFELQKFQIMKKLVLIPFFVLLCTIAAKAQDPIPALSLYDIKGNKVEISDYKGDGKIQVFSFWATWCIPCKEELNNIAEIYEDWQKDYNVELIAVSIDDAKTKANVKSYAEGQGWKLTNSAPLIVPHSIAGSMYRSEDVHTGGELSDGWHQSTCLYRSTFALFSESGNLA